MKHSSWRNAFDSMPDEWKMQKVNDHFEKYNIYKCNIEIGWYVVFHSHTSLDPFPTYFDLCRRRNVSIEKKEKTRAQLYSFKINPSIKASPCNDRIERSFIGRSILPGPSALWLMTVKVQGRKADRAFARRDVKTRKTRGTRPCIRVQGKWSSRVSCKLYGSANLETLRTPESLINA